MKSSKWPRAFLVLAALVLTVTACNRDAGNGSPVATAPEALGIAGLSPSTGSKIQDTINFIAHVLDRRNQLLRQNQDVYVRIDRILNGSAQEINIKYVVGESGKYVVEATSPPVESWQEQNGCIAGTLAGVSGAAVTFLPGTTAPAQQFGRLSLAAQCANALNYGFFSVTLGSLTGTPNQPGVPAVLNCFGYVYAGVPFSSCASSAGGQSG